jgi:hypothetical protein
VVAVKKEEAPRKPSGIQPYEAKNEAEKRVFESFKRFATRDYTISSYTLSEFRNMSEEEKKKLGYSEKELLEDMEEDFEMEVNIEKAKDDPILIKMKEEEESSKAIDASYRARQKTMEISMEKMLQEAAPVEAFNFLQAREKEPKKEIQSVTKNPQTKCKWEIEQDREDEIREKQDLEEQRREKFGFVGTPEKEEEILYKKFLEKVEEEAKNSPPITLDQIKETNRKFDESLKNCINESNLDENFFDVDVDEDTSEGNAASRTLNEEEFKEYGKHDGAMWAPVKLELLKEDLGYKKYEGNKERKKLLEAKSGLIKSLQMQYKDVIPMSGRSKRRKR